MTPETATGNDFYLIYAWLAQEEVPRSRWGQ
jgi:hypothetical protein